MGKLFRDSHVIWLCRIHVWYIYLHLANKNQPNVGKYTSPMDPMAYIYSIKPLCFGSPLWNVYLLFLSKSFSCLDSRSL